MKLRRRIQLITNNNCVILDNLYEGSALQITYAAMDIAFINGVGANVLPEDSGFPDVTFGDWGFIPVPPNRKRISDRKEDRPVLISKLV